MPSFGELDAFCLFVGYPRSGHSLVGSILDAHPEVVIAHEADALKLVAQRGRTREEVFEALFVNARLQAERESGRTQSGYLYEVPGQWQGRVTRLRVLGDKGGGGSSRRLAADPSELRRFAEVVGLPLRLLHVTRNPFDVVARISRVTRRGVPKQTLDEALTRFEVLAVANAALIDGGAFDVLTIRHESFVDDPRAGIREACRYLGVDATDDYVEASAGIVWSQPHRTRELVEWSDRQVDRLERIIERHDFLRGYAFVDQRATA